MTAAHRLHIGLLAHIDGAAERVGCQPWRGPCPTFCLWHKTKLTRIVSKRNLVPESCYDHNNPSETLETGRCQGTLQ